MELNERQQNFITVLGGIKFAHQGGSVWASNEPALHQIAEELIAKGWVLETTALYMDPEAGDKDRCFQLTIKGMKEADFLKVNIKD